MKIFAIIAVALLLASAGFAEQISGVIETKVGDTFMITLGSNGTTGYEWQIAEPINKSLLEFKGSKYIAPETKLVGAPGKEEWTFKAIAAGKAGVLFKYVRPWEKDVKPVKVGGFIIVIK